MTDEEIRDMANRLQELEARVKVLVTALDKFVTVTVKDKNGKKKKMNLGRAVKFAESARLDEEPQYAEPIKARL